MVVVAALLDEARSAGLALRVNGGRLVIRGPKKAGPVAKRVLAHKAEIMLIFQGWNAATATLICWFVLAEPPPEPFQLRRGVTIADPAEYWKYLHGDLASGPRGARAQTGAFQADLRRLHKLFASDREAA